MKLTTWNITKESMKVRYYSKINEITIEITKHLMEVTSWMYSNRNRWEDLKEIPRRNYTISNADWQCLTWWCAVVERPLCYGFQTSLWVSITSTVIDLSSRMDPPHAPNTDLWISHSLNLMKYNCKTFWEYGIWMRAFL